MRRLLPRAFYILAAASAALFLATLCMAAEVRHDPNRPAFTFTLRGVRWELVCTRQALTLDDEPRRRFEWDRWADRTDGFGRESDALSAEVRWRRSGRPPWNYPRFSLDALEERLAGAQQALSSAVPPEAGPPVRHSLPYTSLLGLTGVLPFFWLIRTRRPAPPQARQGQRAGCGAGCRCDLTGNTAGPCRECGTVMPRRAGAV